MQLFNLLSAFANQYTQKYLDRANANRPNLPPGLNRDLLPPNAASPERPGQADKINDAYLPSEPAENEITDPIYTQPEIPSDNPVENENNDDQAVVPFNDTDDTPATTITRRAELNYNLTLQFDLTSFTRTIERLADGEISEIDQLAMASFGLSTQFELSGKEVIEIDSADPSGQNFHARSMQSLKSRQVSMFATQSRDFQALSFQREATDMRRMIDIKFQNNARRAVNKFALRYSSDSQFSFSFAQRLNVQTAQVAAQTPESLGGYLDSAGDVAGAGTTEMMVAFFDAVETYLSANKDQTTKSVTAFFGQAADALGFSGTAGAEFAEANLTNTIDSFFDKVSAAVGDLRTLYLGEAAPVEVSQPAIAQIPADYSPSLSIPVDTATDRLADDRQPVDNRLLAVA